MNQFFSTYLVISAEYLSNLADCQIIFIRAQWTKQLTNSILITTYLKT